MFAKPERSDELRTAATPSSDLGDGHGDGQLQLEVRVRVTVEAAGWDENENEGEGEKWSGRAALPAAPARGRRAARGFAELDGAHAEREEEEREPLRRLEPLAEQPHEEERGEERLGLRPQLVTRRLQGRL